MQSLYIFPTHHDTALPSLVRQSSAVVTGRKYKGFRKDGTGFRVYNAWWQHRRENKIRNDPRVVVQHATDAPIRPHHRSGDPMSEVMLS